MQFVPLSDQEEAAQTSSVWPEGLYDFEVAEAIETTSKSGNDMFSLELWIFNQDGNGRKKIFDYLVLSQKAAWKLKQFSRSCGLLPQYEKGSLMAGEIIGRTGQCMIGTQKAGEFPAKNIIREYLPAKSATPVTQARTKVPERQKAPAGDIDDEIPF